jgi:hypothetical protein
MTDLDQLAARIRAEGFAFAPAAEMRPLLLAQADGTAAGALDDWAAFAASWNDLGLDTYMADGGRYRKRRHATFSAVPGQPIVRAAHQPHYQSRDYNPLNGGIARWFEPILPAVGDSRTLTAILRLCRRLADAQTPPNAGQPTAWHIECHQFRIEARAGIAGRPTPEGRHRDGVDHVLVLLVGRENVREGVTTVAAPDGRELGSFILVQPLDAALVDDLRVLHGVTPIVPEDAQRPGHRDVLVVTFRHQGGR